MVNSQSTQTLLPKLEEKKKKKYKMVKRKVKVVKVTPSMLYSGSQS